MPTVAPKKRPVLHTLAALPLALVVFAVVALLAEVLWFFFSYFQSFLPEVVLRGLAAVIGGLVGVGAAQAACDAWTPDYKRRAVFCGFVAFVALGIVAQLVVGALGTERWNTYVVMAASLLAAWFCFWQDDLSLG